MSPNQALSEKGDFTRTAASMRSSGEALAAALVRHMQDRYRGLRYRRACTGWIDS